MKRVVLLLSMSLAFAASAADVPADAGMAEVQELGRLNGQALACAQSGNMTRIKTAIIQHAPKARRYGEQFEVATNEAYLAQSKADACQDAAVLASEVEAVVIRLRVAVPAALAQ